MGRRLESRGLEESWPNETWQPPRQLRHRRPESGDTPRSIVCASDRVLGSRRTPVLPQASASPLSTCPLSRNVLGNLPSPQSLTDPKSLYQSPSGASGPDSRHSFSLYRSSEVIFRSANRSKRWSRSASGRSVHWIFGIICRKSFGQVPVSSFLARGDRGIR